MFFQLIDFSLFSNIHFEFIAFESLLIFLVLLVLIHLFLESETFHEMRILVFFIYFELVHLFFTLLFLVWALFDIANSGLYMTIVLLLIGASGAETGLFLALFMRYYKLSGATTFLKSDKVIHPLTIGINNSRNDVSNINGNINLKNSKQPEVFFTTQKQINSSNFVVEN